MAVSKGGCGCTTTAPTKTAQQAGSSQQVVINSSGCGGGCGGGCGAGGAGGAGGGGEKPAPPSHKTPPALPDDLPGFPGGSTPPQGIRTDPNPPSAPGWQDPTPPGSGAAGAASPADETITFDCIQVRYHQPGSPSITFINTNIISDFDILNAIYDAGFYNPAFENIISVLLKFEAWAYKGIPSPLGTAQAITGNLIPASIIVNRGSFSAGDNAQNSYYVPYTDSTGWIGIFPVQFREYSGGGWFQIYDTENSQYKSFEFNGSFPKAPFGGSSPEDRSNTQWLELSCCGIVKKQKSSVVCQGYPIDENITGACWFKGKDSVIGTWDEYMGSNRDWNAADWIHRDFLYYIGSALAPATVEVTFRLEQVGLPYGELQFFIVDITDPDNQFQMFNKYQAWLSGNQVGEEDYIFTMANPFVENHIYRFQAVSGNRVKPKHFKLIAVV